MYSCPHCPYVLAAISPVLIPITLKCWCQPIFIIDWIISWGAFTQSFVLAISSFLFTNYICFIARLFWKLYQWQAKTLHQKRHRRDTQKEADRHSRDRHLIALWEGFWDCTSRLSEDFQIASGKTKGFIKLQPMAKQSRNHSGETWWTKEWLCTSFLFVRNLGDSSFQWPDLS